MKLTYTSLRNDILRNIGLNGTTDTEVIAFINTHLQTRYQDLLASFTNYKNMSTQTASTVADQQYYHYPPGIVDAEAATVTQGTIVYPVTVVNSQEQWNYINQYPNTNTFIPQFIFPRKVDFGIWPTPQAAYTLTLTYIYRDTNLIFDDYTTGTVTFTNNSTTVTGVGTAWTAAMQGRYIVPANSDLFPTGYWYRIITTNSPTSFTIDSFYEGLTVAGSKFVVGQAPDLPDEAHILLAWGVTADWYLQRADTAKAAQFNNLYYTGDPQNSQRGGKYVEGGLIGMRERYSERADKKVVNMNAKNRIGFYPNWINQIIP